MSRSRYSCLIGGAALVLMGCARPPAADTPPSGGPPLMVSCAYTGLAAGQGRGFVIHANGRVEQWAGRTPRAGTVVIGRADTVEVRTLLDDVSRARLETGTEQAVGTTSAVLEIGTADGTRRLSWEIGPGAAPVDTTLSALFVACERLALSAR